MPNALTELLEEENNRLETLIECICSHLFLQALVKANQVNAVSNDQPLFTFSCLDDEIEKVIPTSKDLNEILRILVIAELVGVCGYTSDQSRSILGMKDNKCLYIIAVKYIKPHTTYKMNRKEYSGSYSDNGSSKQYVVIEKVQ